MKGALTGECSGAHGVLGRWFRAGARDHLQADRPPGLRLEMTV
jgi:hypothetical protein